MDRLKTEYEGRVEFRLVNVDADEKGSELAGDLGLQYVPSFVFFDAQGVQQDQLVGEVTDKQLKSALDALE